jgi:hypothetical protein
LNFEGNVLFQVQSGYLHTLERLLFIFVIFGRQTFAEILEHVMDVVTFLIVENHGNEQSVLNLQIATVTQRIYKFSSSMVVVHDFLSVARKRLETSRTFSRPVKMFAIV